MTTARPDVPGPDAARADAALSGAGDRTTTDGDGRLVALVTGVGRSIGIGAAVAARLADDGFAVATTWWSPYDERMAWGRDPKPAGSALPGTALPGTAPPGSGGHHVAIEADLELPGTPAAVFDQVEAALGAVSVLVACHCESVDSGILDTTVESFDRHVAVNARATWLLIRELARRFRGAHGTGRIVSLTSDHTVFNLPYGATKAALDRITVAAATELADLGITANVVNPGATDTGWMSTEIEAAVLGATPLGRLGRPADVANLVSFLCSAEGGWINGQLIASNGGAA